MASCSDGCKEEFKKSNFLLDHESPNLFVTSQWRTWTFACAPSVYVFYRLVALIGVTLILASNLLGFHEEFYNYQPTRFFSYFSTWANILLVVDCLIQVICAVDAYMKYRQAGRNWDGIYSSMPLHLKLSWVITNVATCSVLLQKIFSLRMGELFTDQLLNVIYVLINVFITGMPVRIYHVFHSWIFTAIYVLFTVISQLIFDQEAVYEFLDFANSLRTAGHYAMLSIFGVTTAITLFYYALYRIRLAIYDCASKRQVAGPTGGRQEYPTVVDTSSKFPVKSSVTVVDTTTTTGDITAEFGWTIASPRNIDVQPMTPTRISYPGYQGFDNQMLQMQNQMQQRWMGPNGMRFTHVGNPTLIGCNPMWHGGIGHNWAGHYHGTQTYSFM